MTVALDALVLPAFDDLEGLPGEATPWERSYAFTGQLDIDGVPESVQYTESGLGIVPTGVGKSKAATTTTALLASDRIDLSETLILSVGAAGAPPAVPVGSVVISDTIVDWDDKCRFDPDNAGQADAPDEQFGLAMNPYTERQGVSELDPVLVDHVYDLATGVDLTSPNTETADPEIYTGTNLCGDELWHGQDLARQAEWLVDQYGAGPYRVTEMEDAGTATALDRFDRLDQYLAIRGVSNHDRPDGDETARESFFDDEFEDGFGAGIENAVAVAQAVVGERVD